MMIVLYSVILLTKHRRGDSWKDKDPTFYLCIVLQGGKQEGTSGVL